jgi:hypothetical protein
MGVAATLMIIVGGVVLNHLLGKPIVMGFMPITIATNAVATVYFLWWIRVL